MSLVRRVARPMLAAMFVVGGLDQLKHPGAKAKAARPVLDQATKAGLPDDPELLAEALRPPAMAERGWGRIFGEHMEQSHAGTVQPSFAFHDGAAS